MFMLGVLITGMPWMARPQSAMATVSGDSIAPGILGILIDGSSFINGYTKAAPVTVSACDAQSGIAEDGFACVGPYGDNNQEIDSEALEYGGNHFCLTENGVYYFAVRDRAGNTSVVSSRLDCIDNEGPVRKNIFSRIPGAVNGYGRSVIVSVEADDCGAGLAADAYSYDGGDTFTSVSENVFTDNGTEYFVYRDALGNESSDEVVIGCIDRQAPVVKSMEETPVDGINGYGRRSVLTVDAADSKSGLAGRAYSYDDGRTYVSSNSIVLYENGVCIVRVRDGLGNEIRRAVAVSCVDNSGPSIVVTGNPATKVNSDVTLSITVSDGESGVASVWYQNDSVKAKTLIGKYDGKKKCREKAEILQNGSYTFFAYDRLGNETRKTVTVSKIDRSMRSSSGSMRITAPSGSSERQTRGDTRSISIGGGSSASSSSSRKPVVIGGMGSTEENESEESWDGGGKTLFVGVSDNSADYDEPENEEVYIPDAGLITGEMDQALSGGEETEIDYPEDIEDKGPGRGSIIAMGIGIVLGLLLLLVFILGRTGIAELPKIFRGGRTDTEDGAVQPTAPDDDTTGTLSL